MDDDKKPVSLNIDERRAKLKNIEDLTLQAENTRRKATGQPTFTSWDNYQAYLDAEAVNRAKMKTSERPKLPEDEVFLQEAARLMLESQPNSTPATTK